MKTFFIILLLSFCANYINAQDTISIFSGIKTIEKELYFIQKIYDLGKCIRITHTLKNTNKILVEYIYDSLYVYEKNYYRNGNMSIYTVRKYNDSHNRIIYNWYEDGTMSFKRYIYGSNLDSNIEWYRNGKTKSCIIYNKKLQNNGRHSYYYCNGQLGETTVWRNGSLISAEAFDLNGNKIDVGDFKFGNGIFIEREICDSSSYIKSISTYKDGQQNGINYLIDKNGDTIQMDYRKAGLREGIIEKYKNRKIRTKGFYSADKPEGTFLNFNNDGKLSFKELYKNGEIIKTTFIDNKEYNKERINIIKQYILSTIDSDPDSLIQRYFWDKSIKFFYVYNAKPFEQYKQINEIKTLLFQTNKVFDIYTYNDALKLNSIKIEKIEPCFTPVEYSFFTLDEVYIVRISDQYFYFFMEGFKIKSSQIYACYPPCKVSPIRVGLAPFSRGSFEENYK